VIARPVNIFTKGVKIMHIADDNNKEEKNVS
jgi:hypothetical protein